MFGVLPSVEHSMILPPSLFLLSSPLYIHSSLPISLPSFSLTPPPLPPLPFLFSHLLLTNSMSDLEGCLASKSVRSRNAWAKRGL